MAQENFRVQFLRGTAAENDAYTGREGEFTIDLDNKSVRLHDGVTAGGVTIAKVEDFYTKAEIDTQLAQVAGSGVDQVTVQVVSWAGSNFTAPAGITVTKEYDGSSIKITHNKAKFPTGWFAFSRESTPFTAITPSSLRNMQIVSDNEIIITSVSSFETFDLTVTF